MAPSRCAQRGAQSPAATWRLREDGPGWEAVRALLARAVEEPQVLERFTGRPAPRGPEPWPGHRGSGKKERATFALEIGYRGEAFAGFQWQPGKRTVEGLLQETLGSLCAGRTCVVSVAGRTDRGVSASRNVVSFYTWDEEVDAAAAMVAVNAAAPSDLACHRAVRVPREFHATFSATQRHYLYILPLSATRAPAEAIRRELEALPGQTLDFRSLGSYLPQGKCTLCTVTRCDVAEAAMEDGTRVLVFNIQGDRFLRRMVRCLVATAVREAELSGEGSLERVLEAKDSKAAAVPAPAHGLAMTGVDYGP